MAAPLPAKLKTGDITRFATRAAQLAKFRPIVTYWCEYYILQQILSKNLHTGDEECSNYAVSLMDKLEAYKQEHAAEDAVTDDIAAKAYVENFALETFNRADQAQRQNKVTKQTVDTFQAASTFLDLLKIWGPLEREIEAKSKFAKYHALRIVKAIKAGEDPNDTNPVVEEPPTLQEDDLDAELKELARPQAGYQPPTVESAPDSMQPSRPQSTIQSANVPPPPKLEEPSDEPYKVSPIDQEDDNQETERQRSIGGGYFPSVAPTDPSTNQSPPPIHIQTAPSQPPPLQQPFTPSDFYANPGRPSAPTPGSIAPSSPFVPPHVARAVPPPTSVPQTPASAIIPPPPNVPNPSGVPPGGYRTDDDSVMASQKHAKWAISALNFEDVTTAVKELRLALQSLGAS